MFKAAERSAGRSVGTVHFFATVGIRRDLISQFGCWFFFSSLS
jgi:hypothetical protein